MSARYVAMSLQLSLLLAEQVPLGGPEFFSSPGGKGPASILHFLPFAPNSHQKCLRMSVPSHTKCVSEQDG